MFIREGMDEKSSFLVFTGHFEQDEEYVYAICDQAPLTIPGRTEEEADQAMDQALEMYISMLVERGELDDAVREYGVQVIEWPAARHASGAQQCRCRGPQRFG